MIKPLSLLASVICFAIGLSAQTISLPEKRALQKRAALLGLHLSFSDFSNSPHSFSKLNTGYQLSFLNGITGKYDYMVQAGSISPKYRFNDKRSDDEKELLHFISLYGIRRLLADTVRFNPFLCIGLGATYSDARAGMSVNAGTGLQFRISSRTFLHLQLHYQINTDARIDNNITASAGLLGAVFAGKKRQKVKSLPITRVSAAAPVSADKDGDGIPDEQDACPTVAGPASFRGCPDSDGDGIPNHLDACPQVPGLAKYQGCPETQSRNVQDTIITGQEKQVLSDSLVARIDSIASKIFFEVNRAILKPSSDTALNEVAVLLKQHPAYRLLIIGHTDNTGTEQRNRTLSRQRAEVVKDFLARHGIAKERMRATGMGSSQPVADNNSPEGRSRNRRTEFRLVP